MSKYDKHKYVTDDARDRVLAELEPKHVFEWVKTGKWTLFDFRLWCRAVNRRDNKKVIDKLEEILIQTVKNDYLALGYDRSIS